jgi:tRNA (mo5U34)-methyltransferase
MNPLDVQREIDDITWYHEFDFGNGLKTRAKTHDVEAHRAFWRNIEARLDTIDFVGKTVLDIGCWDGYWSFHAERRGAKHVLAVDDASQNWAGNRGLQLAKSLLGSSIETRNDVSVYDLESLGQTFDVVLCLGVYYHLVDPFHALAQVRHCCHENTVVVFEGDASMALPTGTMHYDVGDPALPIFVPTPEGFAGMLRACYFDVVSQTGWPPENEALPSWKKRLEIVKLGLRTHRRPLPPKMVRLTSICRPFDGENPLHVYKPPFGLHRYDPRYR